MESQEIGLIKLQWKKEERVLKEKDLGKIKIQLNYV